MARLIFAGAEIDAGTTATPQSPDGVRLGNLSQVSRDTSVFRSGSASWKFDSGGSNLSSYISLGGFGGTNSRSVYCRAYVRTATAAGTAVPILFLEEGTNSPKAQLRTDGGLELLVSNAVQGSPSAAIADSAWHRVEIGGTLDASGNWTSAELRLDGATVATWSGTQARSGFGTVVFGLFSTPGASVVLNVDDVAWNDSTGSANTTWCGAGAVVLLKPTADSAVGTGWTLGTGTAISGNSGKTAVSNTPPLGVADLAAGSDPKQIRNASSNANVNYDATMTTYTAAGVGAGDVVNAVQYWVGTAAPLVTAAKLGTVGIVSNPTIANVSLSTVGTSGAFWSGNAAGTYNAGWKWSAGTMSDAPAVTKGTAPVMRITQVTASTRIAIVCGMFIYADYSPAPPARRVKHSSQVAVMRPSLR